MQSYSHLMRKRTRRFFLEKNGYFSEKITMCIPDWLLPDFATSQSYPHFFKIASLLNLLLKLWCKLSPPQYIVSHIFKNHIRLKLNY